MVVTVPVCFLYIWPRRLCQRSLHLRRIVSRWRGGERETKGEEKGRERWPVVEERNKTKRCCAPGCDRRLRPCLWRRSGAAEMLSEATYLPACSFIWHLLFFEQFDLRLRLRGRGRYKLFCMNRSYYEAVGYTAGSVKALQACAVDQMSSLI